MPTPQPQHYPNSHTDQALDFIDPDKLSMTVVRPDPHRRPTAAPLRRPHRRPTPSVAYGDEPSRP